MGHLFGASKILINECDVSHGGGGVVQRNVTMTFLVVNIVM